MEMKVSRLNERFEKWRQSNAMDKNSQLELLKSQARSDYLQHLANEISHAYNKLSITTYNQLHNLKFKLEQNQAITAQVDFTRFDRVRSEIESL